MIGWLRNSLMLAVLCAGTACSSSKVFVADRQQGWETVSPPSEEIPTYSLYLIGDAGDADTEAHHQTLQLLRTQLAETGATGGVVFLGDNLHCCGLPDSSSSDRAEAEKHLLSQLQAVDDFLGDIIFLPGNQDWNNSSAGGREALARQEAYVETYLDRGNTFLPDDGFPGPVAVELTDDITLLVLDTEWWLSDEAKSFGDTGSYELQEAGDFLNELEDLLYKHRKKHIIVAAHHPLFSNAKHAGRYPLRAHVKPLPLIGSFEPLYRRIIGKRQDLAHPRYRSLIKELRDRFAEYDGLIYAAGHEHNLQYFRDGGPRYYQHHVISGAGSQPRYVAPGGKADFTAATSGFMVLHFYDDQSVWLEAWTPEGAADTLLFRTRLKDASTLIADEEALSFPEPNPIFADSTQVIRLQPTYAKGGVLREALLGSNHRAAWNIPLELPILDIGSVQGGMLPVKIGGRGQSVSMRLRNAEGREFVARSIDKVAGKVWDPKLRQTFAIRLTQDQFSMLHPYAAFAIPPLASAVGVFHTNPRPYIVPSDPRLGPNGHLLAGQPVLFEERPDDDMSHQASMGRASDVISYTKLFQEIEADNDHRVDGYAFARARLFDMLIADWDRHPDQWRWAAFEPADEKGKIYRPIPRDRDVAFMRVNGLFPTLYKLLFEPMYQDFRKSYGFLPGLNKNGLAQDRRFTAMLTQHDWVAIADSMRQSLTDIIIEDAIRTWPEAMFAYNGAEVIEILKVRRDKLPEIAARYYRVIAEVVDVVGSNKHERFEVTRHSDNTVHVDVLKTTKEGKVRKKLYSRTFLSAETREIRLYGLDGNDQFIITGEAPTNPSIIVVGGEGPDIFTDRSYVAGSTRRTHYYDTFAGNRVDAGNESRVHQSDDPFINNYDFNGFTYDLIRPVGYFGNNPDDGLFIGGGVQITKHGFRKEPFARQHVIVGNFAARTRAYNVAYEGHFVDALRGTDVGLRAQILAPDNVLNFFGLGNDTDDDEGSSRFYQAQLSQVIVEPYLLYELERGIRLTIGPTFEFIDIEQDDDRFVGTPQAGISRNTFEPQWLGGFEMDVELGTIDNPQAPLQGIRLATSADINIGLENTSASYSTLASSLSLYVSPILSPTVTIATRVGTAHLIGDFPFYDANTLGGTTNLRGYRANRFAGRTSFYNNWEVRAKILDYAGYLAYGKLGLLTFFDWGRVWADEETSQTLHTGYGVGLWTQIINTVVLNGTLGLSDEDRTFTVGIGFFY